MATESPEVKNAIDSLQLEAEKNFHLLVWFFYPAPNQGNGIRVHQLAPTLLRPPLHIPQLVSRENAEALPPEILIIRTALQQEAGTACTIIVRDMREVLRPP